MARLLLHTLLWGCWLTTVHAEPCNQGQYQVNGRCCDLCQPGTILMSDCAEGISTDCPTSNSDTICKSCPDGFFSNMSSAYDKCHPWTSCRTQDLAEVKAGTTMSDALCGPWPRSRVLLAIPSTLGALLALLLVAVIIKKALQKSKKKAALPEDKGKEPVEVIFLEDVPGTNPVAPVQETLHGCQPVTQEDGKESRVSVQERL
ncbi:tumor necrosis factor receptor superfamily member 5 [Echinops telfairi]|uniref:Tumor necrosis factor receptor superfamily member 5 n=1 Tax=Echinops telfairi TaxID=9371 RepID=A0AC55DI46_ECHTE|nr:tumor necrosis factor receptor superfamily member 5 [Echinops telfairi]